MESLLKIYNVWRTGIDITIDLTDYIFEAIRHLEIIVSFINNDITLLYYYCL